MSGGEASGRTRPPYWVFTLYFAEGFPYSLVRQISTVYFKDLGASLEAVGLTSLYGLPWVFKALWAPLLDAFLTKRRWLLAAEAALAGGAVLFALAAHSPWALSAGALAFLLLAFLSATHDIAVDGYYLEALDRRQQAAWVGFQAMAYRLALIAGGGGVVWLSGVLSWRAGFLAAALLLSGLCLFHAGVLPAVERPGRPLGSLPRLLLRPGSLRGLAMAGLLGALLWAGASLPALGPARNLASELLRRLSIPGAVAVALLLALLVLLLLRGRLLVRLRNSDGFYARAFVEYLDRDRVGILLAFLVLYRAGESLLLAMLYPFMATLGLGRSDYGLLYGTFGVASSIAGGLLGGRIIARAGLRRAVWPLVLAQNVPNLLYGLLALWHGGGASVPVPAIGAFVVVESFGAGMGTAAFLVTIMRTCKKEHRAAHMAVATSIMNVSSAMAGVFSGFLAARLGWPLFFLATFLAACPAMGLLPFLPVLQEE